MSENQMFRNLAGNPPGRGERLRDNSELYKIPEGGNFKHGLVKERVCWPATFY